MDRTEITTSQYTVVDLAEDQIDSVYPLVRASDAAIRPEQWRTYFDALRPNGGVLVLTASEGSPFGFIAYRKLERLPQGPVLEVDLFVTFELCRLGEGRRALSQAVEAIARKQKCTAVEIRLCGKGYSGTAATAKPHRLTGLGYEPQGLLLRKPLAASPA